MRQTMTMSDGNIIVNCDEPINGYQQFVFSPGTIASWTALLGLGSTAEAVAAIMQGHDAIRSVNRQGGLDGGL